MTTDDQDIYAGLTFAEDLAREQMGRLRAVDEEPPDPDRDGSKWRGADPRLPETLTRRLEAHLSAGRSQLRVANRRGDTSAAASAQRRIDLTERGFGADTGQWWSRTVTEASDVAAAVLAELDAGWGAGGDAAGGDRA